MKDGGLKLLQIQDNGTGIRVGDRGVGRGEGVKTRPYKVSNIEPLPGHEFPMWKLTTKLRHKVSLGKLLFVPSLVASLRELILFAPIRSDSGFSYCFSLPRYCVCVNNSGQCDSVKNCVTVI